MSESPKPTPAPYSYSRSNKIFLGIVVAGAIILAALTFSSSPSRIGLAIGTLIGIWLWPTLISWIVWQISRKNATALSITFNIVLGQFLNSENELNDLSMKLIDVL